MSGTSPLVRIIIALALLWLGRMGIYLAWSPDSATVPVRFLGFFALDVLILVATVLFAVRLIRRHPGTSWFWLLSLSVIIAVVSSTNHWATALSDRAKRPPDSAQAPPVLDMRGTVADWQGPIDFDSFEALKNTLELHPHVRSLSLDSNGGRVAAARGMARLVSQANLDTVVSETCASACTLVFIAGEKRALALGGQLGFHGYRLISSIQTIDTETEQLRDQEMFQKHGVDASFLDRAFSVPFEEMWFPDRETLLRSGLVTD